MINIGDKITIYAKGALGISKHEGFLVAFDARGVTFRKPRAKYDSMIESYYSPFWTVVSGWGHPAPGSPWTAETPGTTPGVTVSRGLYRSTDPRWVEDFLAGPGAELELVAMFRDGELAA